MGPLGFDGVPSAHIWQQQTNQYFSNNLPTQTESWYTKTKVSNLHHIFCMLKLICWRAIPTLSIPLRGFELRSSRSEVQRAIN